MTNRYIRQANVIGKDGQLFLKSTKILVIGAGGLGNLVSSYLVAAGLINITIIDNDRVEITNLTRQITYHENDCGISKVIILQKHLQALNSESKVNALDVLINKINVDSILLTHDFIIDCSDNFITKYLISDTCNLYGKPLITASIDGFFGQVLILNRELCYRCVFPNAVSDKSCFDGDVIGSAVGIIASYQANEVLKFITRISTQSKLIQVDCLNNITRPYNLSPDLDCINTHSLELDIKNQPQSITISEAKRLMSKNSLQALDMRKIAVNKLDFESIPFDLDMVTKIDYPKTQPLAVICNHGYRSKFAAMKLGMLGYKKVYYIKLS